MKRERQSEGSVVRQYKGSFHAFGIDVIFADEGLRAIAEQAADENAGARGLLTVCERVLREFKYELPGSAVRQFVVTRALVGNPAAKLQRILHDPDYARQIPQRLGRRQLPQRVTAGAVRRPPAPAPSLSRGSIGLRACAVVVIRSKAQAGTPMLPNFHTRSEPGVQLSVRSCREGHAPSWPRVEPRTRRCASLQPDGRCASPTAPARTLRRSGRSARSRGERNRAGSMLRGSVGPSSGPRACRGPVRIR